MDPPEHTRPRRLLTGQCTARRMDALEERLREIATEADVALRTFFNHFPSKEDAILAASAAGADALVAEFRSRPRGSRCSGRCARRCSSSWTAPTPPGATTSPRCA